MNTTTAAQTFVASLFSILFGPRPMALADKEITYYQFFLLGRLETEILSMTEISKHTGHSTAAATGLVDRLEKLGYVQRVHDQEDRRKIFVHITRKGIQLVAAVKEEMVKTIKAMATDSKSEPGPIPHLIRCLTADPAAVRPAA